MASGTAPLRIVVHGPDRRVGALVDEVVIDLGRAISRLAGRPAEPGSATLLGLIERGPDGLAAARAAVDEAVRGGLADMSVVVPLAATRLHAPSVDRPRIACAAGNYAAHTLGSAARKGVSDSHALAGIADPGAAALPTADEVTERTRERGVPRGFWKDFALPKGPDDDITYPARAERFDYEGEVAVVIGPAAKNVADGHGGDHIWGVTLLNDWSIRGANVKDSLSFNLGKNFDGAASVGPCIVVGDIDPSDLLVETRVDGELRQHYHSGDMIFDHARYIEYLSRDLTLLPGDLVSGGSGPGSATDAAKGDDPDLSWFLRVGNVVEVSAAPIGTLRNRIVAR